MKKKYYFISFRIDLRTQSPHYSNEVIDQTPFDYILYHKELGGDYANRSILFAQEISEEEYNKYKEVFED